MEVSITLAEFQFLRGKKLANILFKIYLKDLKIVKNIKSIKHIKIFFDSQRKSISVKLSQSDSLGNIVVGISSLVKKVILSKLKINTLKTLYLGCLSTEEGKQ